MCDILKVLGYMCGSLKVLEYGCMQSLPGQMSVHLYFNSSSASKPFFLAYLLTSLTRLLSYAMPTGDNIASRDSTAPENGPPSNKCIAEVTYKEQSVAAIRGAR